MRADLHHGHDWLPAAAYLPYFIIYLLYEPSVQGIMHVNLHKMYVVHKLRKTGSLPDFSGQRDEMNGMTPSVTESYCGV